MTGCCKSTLHARIHSPGFASWRKAVLEWDDYIALTDITTYYTAVAAHICSGCPPFFSFTEESFIARFIVRCATDGAALTVTEIKKFMYISLLCDSRTRRTRPIVTGWPDRHAGIASPRWWDGFMKRWKRLISRRSADALDHTRRFVTAEHARVPGLYTPLGSPADLR